MFKVWILELKASVGRWRLSKRDLVLKRLVGLNSSRNSAGQQWYWPAMLASHLTNFLSECVGRRLIAKQPEGLGKPGSSALRRAIFQRPCVFDGIGSRDGGRVHRIATGSIASSILSVARLALLLKRKAQATFLLLSDKHAPMSGSRQSA